MLPRLEASTRVNIDSSKHDKIEFSQPVGCILDTCADAAPDAFAAHVFEMLGGAPERSAVPTDCMSFHSRIFGRRRGGTLLLLRTRQHLPAPLFAGELRGRKSRRGVDQLGFNLEAKANLTRYVRHQDVNRARRGERAIAQPATLVETLFRRTPEANHDGKGEFALDDQDNWIPEAAVFHSFCSRWGDRQREYLSAIVYAMDQELARVQSHSGAMGHPLAIRQADGSLSLKAVETYWEFGDDDPLSLVSRLEPKLKAYCEGDFEQNTFWEISPRFSTGFTRERRLNCNVLVAKVAPGIKLVIYAKTNKRVRFEVRHDLRKVSQSRRLPQSCDSVDDAVGKMAAITADAVGVCNRFLDYLRASRVLVACSPSPVEFLYLCGKHAMSAGDSEAIVSMLIANGCVVALKPLAPSLRRMLAAGLLVRAVNEQGGQSQMFNVAPTYRQALKRLQEVSSPGTLTTRQRMRI